MSFYEFDVYNDGCCSASYSVYEKSDTGNFAVDDIMDYAAEHNININHIACINNINIDGTNSDYAFETIKRVVNEIKSKGIKIIITRYGVRSDEFVSNRDEAVKRIGDIGYLFVRSGFAPFNNLCKFEWSIPYIYVDEDSKDIVKLLIQDGLY